MPMRVGQKPFQVISMDLKGTLDEAPRGNKYVLVINDSMTKFAITEPIPQANKRTIIEVLLTRMTLIYGPPEVLLTDRGANLVSKYCEQIYAKYAIKHVITSAYHPQVNGVTENFNKYVGQNLAIFSPKSTDWDLYVPFMSFAYNTAVHSVTEQTPYYMLMGFEPRVPFDALIGDMEISDKLVTRAEQLICLQQIRNIALDYIREAQEERIAEGLLKNT